MIMNSIPHSAQTTRAQSHPVLGGASEGDAMADTAIDLALADSHDANSVNLPSIDQCHPAESNPPMNRLS